MKCVVVAASLFLAVLVSGCSGGESKQNPTASSAPSGTPEASMTGTSTATTTPDIDAVFGVKVIQLKRGDAVPLPRGVVLYARDGVWEGASGDLTRYYVDATGQFRSDDLFVSQHGEEPRALLRAYGTGSNDLWADICHGYCYGSPDPVTTMRSQDGGITWQTIFDGVISGPYVIGSYGAEIVLREWSVPGVLQLSRGTIGGAVEPEALPATIPADADAIADSGVPGIPVFAFSEKKMTIWDVSTGAELAKIPLPNPFQHLSIQGSLPGSDGKKLMMTWYGPGGSPDWDWYFGEFDLRAGKFSRVAKGSMADGLDSPYGVQWLGPTVAVARVGFNVKDYVPEGSDYFGAGVPTIIDFESGLVTPIAEFLPFIGAKAGGPIPVAVQVGGFATVKTGSDCLNVRQSPSLSGQVLGCYADRVILTRGGAEPSGGWLPVHTPDGRQGWAAAEFLEQFP